MNHSRVAGGLAAFAVLLIVISAPVAVAAKASPRPVNSRAVAIAQRYLGVPYVFGGASRSGFDSSGLTMYVFGKLGVRLPHGATDQQRLSKPIRPKNLRRGDLVFWGSAAYSYRVAIYVGHGRVIQVTHRGDVVRYGSIRGAWIGGRLLPVR
jgi:cell wall-associated NlpC family hydrolase